LTPNAAPKAASVIIEATMSTLKKVKGDTRGLMRR
jgi:hypothetical protein